MAGLPRFAKMTQCLLSKYIFWIGINACIRLFKHQLRVNEMNEKKEQQNLPNAKEEEGVLGMPKNPNVVKVFTFFKSLSTH